MIATMLQASRARAQISALSLKSFTYIFFENKLAIVILNFPIIFVKNINDILNAALLGKLAKGVQFFFFKFRIALKFGLADRACEAFREKERERAPPPHTKITLKSTYYIVWWPFSLQLNVFTRCSRCFRSWCNIRKIISIQHTISNRQNTV